MHSYRFFVRRIPLDFQRCRHHGCTQHAAAGIKPRNGLLEQDERVRTTRYSQPEGAKMGVYLIPRF